MAQEHPRKMDRKILCDKEPPHHITSFFNKEVRFNPCMCGSNCTHYEYDGTTVYQVCNSCSADLSYVKPEYTQKYLEKGVWRKMTEVFGPDDI